MIPLIDFSAFYLFQYEKSLFSSVTSTFWSIYPIGFKRNKDLINNIRLDSSDNYTPYLDDFDIYNISSSSDNIRIILSYYLALLQTSLKHKNLGKIIYPNILILDEPKQQNLDNDSLIDCITVIETIPSNESQVILTTYSKLLADREKFSKHIIYEMQSKNDYLLKPM